MEQSVILSAVRTPMGKFLGGLSPLSATELGTIVVRAAVEAAGIDPNQVDEIIMGNVLSAGLGQNPARQAGLRGGLNPRVAAMTINKVCGSGLKAVALADQSLRLGETEIQIAGGMESMSNSPYLLANARTGYRLGNGQAIDSMIHDGLWDPYENFHMAMTAELVAEKFNISRDEQDRYALESHRRAVRATKECYFQSQIVPVEISGRKGEKLTLAKDESPREDTTMEALARLKPVFKPGGTVTAGNAPGTNDGAAAFVLTGERTAERLGKAPIARVVAQTTSGVEPKWVMMAPVEAVEKLLQKTGWDRDRDVDLIELNEAFAVQALAVVRQLHLDPEKVNVNGGAVALGHPIGASGARILVTLVHEMQRRNVKRGIAALCLGGGNAVALAVER